MKLRYFQTYDKNGVNSEISLQRWSYSRRIWEDIKLIRVAEDEEEWERTNGYNY